MLKPAYRVALILLEIASGCETQSGIANEILENEPKSCLTVKISCLKRKRLILGSAVAKDLLIFRRNILRLKAKQPSCLYENVYIIYLQSAVKNYLFLHKFQVFFELFRNSSRWDRPMLPSP